jgi:hypothetical protein
MSLPQVLLKILGFLSKGPNQIIKNIEKSPKGPRVGEGDKHFIRVPFKAEGGRGKADKSSQRVPVTRPSG